MKKILLLTIQTTMMGVAVVLLCQCVKNHTDFWSLPQLTNDFSAYMLTGIRNR
ncbi:MAG: hypothetical protein LIO74_09805 [Ruminococcus sp.]|nr:hypothetical protein [Ruminococcus sp.]